MKLRHQGDGKGDTASNATVKDFSEPVMVRAEYGPESQVKNILKKYGALPIPQREPHFTETDFDTDLTTALHRIKKADEAFAKLPLKHREKYPSASALWQAWKENRLIPDEPTQPIDNTPTTTHNG